MFRGVFFGVVLGVSGQCPTCQFDAAVLEHFTSNFEVKQLQIADDGEVTTMAMPSTRPSVHGSMAVDARNFYVKLDTHTQFPTPFHPPDMPELDLSGLQIHEEFHVNGIVGKASYHLEGELVNVCIDVDLPAHITEKVASLQPMMDAYIQQAETMAPVMVQQYGSLTVLDGQPAMLLAPPDSRVFAAFSLLNSHPVAVLAHAEEADFVLNNRALKFTDYSNYAGDESIRACEISGQDAMQSFLSTNPDARAFVRSRIVEHQHNLQATLQPKSLNTRFNFVPLELVDLMVPVQQPCATNLVETPMQVSSVASSVVFGIFFFSMGVAVHYGFIRQRKVALADQVSA